MFRFSKQTLFFFVKKAKKISDSNGGFIMKKTKLVTLTAAVLLSGGLLAACSPDEKPAESSTPESSVAASSDDAVSSASITDKPEEIVKSLSAEGNWITAATADVTVDQEIVVEMANSMIKMMLLQISTVNWHYIHKMRNLIF